MTYKIGDKFLLETIECEVAYVNNGFAWLAPIYKDEVYYDVPLNPLVAFTRIGPKGIDSMGNKAKPIVNKECGAV